MTDQNPDLREQLLDALDFSYCQGLGFDTPEALLVAYDAARAVPVPPPADQTAFRQRIAEAIWERQNPGRRWADCEYRWRADAEADADAVVAVLPEQTDRAAVLREAATIIEAEQAREEATEWAQYGSLDHETELGGGYVRASAALLRRVAAEEQPAETGCRETAEYFVQCQQPDGTWEQASSMAADPEVAAQRLAARRKTQPDLVLRMAERTTKVNVRALPDCLVCRHWSCTGGGQCGALLDAWQRCTCTGPAVGEQPETQETPVLPCNYWTLTRTEHTPHRWEPQPGMDPVHCPGFGRTPE